MIEEQVVAQKVRRTAAEIKQIAGEFESSGMSRSQFCRVRGLTFGVLSRYLERMRAAADRSANSDGLVAVEAACAEALGGGAVSSDVILNTLARRRQPPPAVTIVTPDALRLHHAPLADCARYDRLRSVTDGAD